VEDLDLFIVVKSSGSSANRLLLDIVEDGVLDPGAGFSDFATVLGFERGLSLTVLLSATSSYTHYSFQT